MRIVKGGEPRAFADRCNALQRTMSGARRLNVPGRIRYGLLPLLLSIAMLLGCRPQPTPDPEPPSEPPVPQSLNR